MMFRFFRGWTFELRVQTTKIEQKLTRKPDKNKKRYQPVGQKTDLDDETSVAIEDGRREVIFSIKEEP
jgi:hypothetical protein